MNEAPRPPYVQFEVRAVEDRAASIEAGHYVAKDVVFALVTPAGTRERIEKPAEDWIKGIEEGVKQERIPAEWEHAYKDALERFTKNQEAPEFGTPIKNYPAVSPAQARMLTDIGIVSVEQLAEATEEALGRIGMGARAMKAKAQAYLDSSKDVGKVSAELDKLREENAALTRRDAEREERLAEMERRLAAIQPAATPVNNQAVDEEDTLETESED